MHTSPVFREHENGVRHMRIPALCRTRNGTLLAFCEARDGGDQSHTDLVLRRSGDNGNTWGPIELVIKAQAQLAIMNPCVVNDPSTGTVFCFANIYPEHAEGTSYSVSRQYPGRIRTVFTRSDDDSIHWSPPADITDSLTNPKDDVVLATGPGCGIHLSKNDVLLIPFTFTRLSDGKKLATVIRSHDHGKTWQCGGHVETTSMETQVALLSDGRLRMDMRNDREQEKPVHCRHYAISRDAGLLWDGPYRDEKLNDVRCQASMISAGDPVGQPLLLHSSPDAAYSKRINMTLRASRDDGQTWSVLHRVHPGPCAYSCMVLLPDGQIGILFEGGEQRIKEGILFARVKLPG